MRQLLVGLALGILLTASFASSTHDPNDPQPVVAPPGVGPQDPWVDARGDSMYGDLYLRGHTLWFDDVALQLNQDGRLTLDGNLICFVGESACLGIKGDRGLAGPRGVQGAMGPVGPMGPTGPQGPPGDTVTGNCPTGHFVVSIQSSTISCDSSAGLLDGIDSNQFLRSDADDATSGSLTVGQNLHIDGDVTVSPRVRHYSISPVDIVMSHDGQDYERTQEHLRQGSPGTDVTGFAPVHLPDGATVTNVRLYFQDNVPDGEVTVTLYRNLFYGTSNTMATLTSGMTQTPGINDVATSAINFATIDNGAYGYALQVGLLGNGNGQDPTDVQLGGVVIDYVITNL